MNEQKEPLVDYAQPIKTVAISKHENTLIYYEAEIEDFGVVRVQSYADSLNIWAGGVVVAKVSRKIKL